jgi:hypothetical protein
MARPLRVVPTAFLVALCAFARLAAAGSLETVIDNDTNAFVPGAATTDRYYTQGARFSWFADAGAMPRWASRVAERLGRPDDERRFGLSFGQEIYTPDAISTARAITDDRPYAGWLYGSAFVTTSDDRRLRTVEIAAGMVGPNSYAQHAQTWWHHELGIRQPRGWRWQLHDEPAVMIRVQEKRRPWGRLRHADLVPHAGFAVGNVLTYANAGATLRVGAPLPDDFGPSPITPPGPGERGRLHLFAFARAEGRAVARNVFLDGTMFHPGPNVHRIPFVGEAQLGAGARWHLVALRYTFSYTTNEFRERTNSHEYGSFGIAF